MRRGASWKRTLNSLSPARAIQIIRAYSFFSHLANIAEDQHHIRRTRAHALAGFGAARGDDGPRARRAHARPGIPRAQLRPSSPTAIIAPGADRPSDRGAAQEHASTARWRSPQLLAERDRIALTPEEHAASDEALRRAVLTLWQTNLLRGTKLAVLDEVANGISYYDYTFLRELPRFYAALEDLLAAADPAWSGTELPSFLRMGSWIGGDRDGNPFVTAEVLRQALRLQSNRGARASIWRSCMCWAASCRSTGGWSASPTSSRPWRSARPTTRRTAATSPIGVPSPASMRGLRRRPGRWITSQSPHHAVGEAPPYRRRRRARSPTSRVLHRSLAANGSTTLARGRLRTLRRAVDVFGFHLAGLDLRQNSDVHERAVGELLEVGCPGTGYAALGEDRRVDPAAEELATSRPAHLAVRGLLRRDRVRAGDPARSG